MAPPQHTHSATIIGTLCHVSHFPNEHGLANQANCLHQAGSLKSIQSYEPAGQSPGRFSGRWRALFKGTAWAGFSAIHHHHHTCRDTHHAADCAIITRTPTRAAPPSGRSELRARPLIAPPGTSRRRWRRRRRHRRRHSRWRALAAEGACVRAASSARAWRGTTRS